MERSPFDAFILATIICNCVTMAWESPLDPPGTAKAHFIDMCEIAYLYIFTFELCVKMLAYGILCHRDSYLRDAWCQLDFVVVTLAWLPVLIPTFGNYSAIRTVRTLRPLRALKRVPGMPVLVQSILSALPRVGNVCALCGFIFLVFAIVGVEAFKGVLHYRCALPGFVESADHPSLLDDVDPERRSRALELAAHGRRAARGGAHGGASTHAQAQWHGDRMQPEPRAGRDGRPLPRRPDLRLL